MNKKLLSKLFLIWLTFIPIAIINGSIRHYLYQPYIGELLAHQLSTLSASLFLFLTVYLYLKNFLPTLSYQSAFLTGLILVLLTILFEFIFGHYIVGHSWQKLFADYDLSQGKIWSLFLVTMLFTPALLKKLIKK